MWSDNDPVSEMFSFVKKDDWYILKPNINKCSGGTVDKEEDVEGQLWYLEVQES